MGGNPFDVLGVEHDATYSEARRAYLRRVRLLHPDRVTDDPELGAEATKLTAELTAAWAAVKPTFATTTPVDHTDVAGHQAGQQRAEDHRGSSTTSATGSDSADEILDWMVGAILGVADRSHKSLSGDELLLLYGSGTKTLAHRRRSAGRVRRRVQPLLVEAIASDLANGSHSVPAPSGLDVPAAWWDDYVRLDELGNDSLLLFMLDEILDPPSGDRPPW